MDYLQPLEFGSFITPAAENSTSVVQLAQLSEDVVLDLVTVQDHPYQSSFLDTWTLLSVIAARTERIRVSPNVANLPLRPPAVLARSVATLDLLTGGRAELGLGAGGFYDPIAAIGGPRLTAKQAVDALTEGIEVIRAVWGRTGERSIHLEGEHYRVWGAHPGPVPAHDVGIWLGSYKPRMLRLTGRLADGWLPSSGYAGPEQLAELSALVDEAAVAAGRDPAAVKRLYNISGTFARTGSGFLQGPAPQWVEQLAELTLTHGTSTFILAADDPDLIRRFAAEVAPGVRELVAAQRDGGSAVPADGDRWPVTVERRATPAPTLTTGVSRLGAERLAVVATPPPVSRHSSEEDWAGVWDEADRPAGPGPDPDRLYTPHEQASGRHLVDVHDMLRSELREVRDIVDQVINGALAPGVARSQINTMTMRQNNWTAGVYCASYCRVVTTHHSLEDSSVFPHLRRSEPGLAPVIDRLEAEHRVIHDVLEGVDVALVAFVSQPDGPDRLRRALDLLTDALLSHLSYEERELVEPLARVGF